MDLGAAFGCVAASQGLGDSCLGLVGGGCKAVVGQEAFDEGKLGWQIVGPRDDRLRLLFGRRGGLLRRGHESCGGGFGCVFFFGGLVVGSEPADLSFGFFLGPFVVQGY